MSETTSNLSEALEGQFGLAARVVDEKRLDNSVKRFREQGITLPTFAEMTDPSTVPADRVGDSNPQGADSRNLWRLHWYNDLDGNRVTVPDHVVLPKELTGIDTPIVVIFGDRFPMITAHKVMPAYGCLAPRVVCGQFDPTFHRAIWPSTGNYARGGIAISRIMASRGVAILPEGMSKERFDWLNQWCENPEQDVIRTYGTESNVKEIYDACNELAKDPKNFVLNQFSEFANHLIHYNVTGRALEHAWEVAQVEVGRPLKLSGMVSSTGSAGTIAAGEYLKKKYGTKVGALEALECPTLLNNGFGEHNIQGIGDKHLPLIHNIMNHDFVAAISDQATDHLLMLFTTNAGRKFLTDRRHVPVEVLDALRSFGVSSICNMLGAITMAKKLGMGADDCIVTVATDGAAMYISEAEKISRRDFQEDFGPISSAITWGRHLADVPLDACLELTYNDKVRIFNLGYYTWVEQQGTPFELFMQRKNQSFWEDLQKFVPVWDEMIVDFNARVAAKS